MHWRPEHINPMLALRLALLNERWAESWQEQHAQASRRRKKMKRTPFDVSPGKTAPHLVYLY